MRVLQTIGDFWALRPVRGAVALTAGALWWWVVLTRVGPCADLVAAGGWTLGLIPLHTHPSTGPRRRSGAGIPPPRARLSARLPGHGGSAVRAEDLAGQER